MPFKKGHKFYTGGEKNWFKKDHSVRLGMKHTEKTIKKISESRQGKCLAENNASYKNGSTKLIQKIKRLTEYKNWQIKVLKRDNYTCRKCDQRGGYKIPHHLVSFAYLLQVLGIKSIGEAKNNAGLFNIRNGVTMCPDCHKETPNFSYKQRLCVRDRELYLIK